MISKTGLAIALFTTFLNANSAHAESGRWDTDANIVSLPSDWKRDKVAFSEGQPKQYSLGDRIWYTKNKNTLHFFKLVKPGQAATIAYMDIVEKGQHKLSPNELKDLNPVYEQTSEHTPQMLDGKVQSLGGRNVVVIDGSWSWMPCSQAYKGLKPGEKLNTNLRVRTVLALNKARSQFDGVDFTTANDVFESEVANFDRLLTQVKWK